MMTYVAALMSDHGERRAHSRGLTDLDFDRDVEIRRLHVTTADRAARHTPSRGLTLGEQRSAFSLQYRILKWVFRPG
jgi:hypothetical protein